jgi:hypothetical protein
LDEHTRALNTVGIAHWRGGVTLRFELRDFGFSPVGGLAPRVIDAERVHCRERFAASPLTQEALGKLEAKLGSLWQLGIDCKQVVECICGARVVGAKQRENAREACFYPNGLVWALLRLCEELGRPFRAMTQELEPPALECDPVSDAHEASPSQVEVQSRFFVVRGCDLVARTAVSLDRAGFGWRRRRNGRR